MERKMLTPLHRQAIDIAARVMRETINPVSANDREPCCRHDDRELRTVRDGELVQEVTVGDLGFWHVPSCKPAQPWFCVLCYQIGKPNAHHYYDSGLARPVPVEVRDAAALWLGHVERANGCPLPEIVEAARKAAPSECRNCGHDAFHRFVSPTGCEVCGCIAPHFAPEFDLSAFISALTLEALGRGVSWFEDHERFRLLDRVQPMSPSQKPYTRLFEVPPLEFEYDKEEANRA